MAAHSVCSFNKFGYCKYRNECRKLHINEICDGSSSCEFLTCKFRHPKICNWYSEYGRCKFNPCAFKHVDSPNVTEEIRKENTEIKAKLNEIDKSLKCLEEREKE